MKLAAAPQYHKSMGTDNQPDAAIVVALREDRDAKLVRSALKRLGFSVMSSEDGREASTLLASRERHLELAVVDPATPGLDFRGLLKKLEDTGSNVHVLCLCDEGSEEAVQSLHFGGRVDGYLKRPFRRSHLLTSILDATESPLVRTA